MTPQNDRKIYKEVLRKRIASIKRKLAATRNPHVRARLQEQLQEQRRILGR